MTGTSPRRAGRRQIVLPLVVLGGLAVATAAPTWLTTVASTVLDNEVTVTVTGTTAAPGVSAAALVVIAAGLALGLVGRIARWFSLLVVMLGGVVIAGSALNIVRAPEAAARSGVAEATGVIGVVGDVSVSVAPYLALLCGIAIIAVGVRAIVAPVEWGSRTTKYDTPATGTAAPTAGTGGTPTPTTSATPHGAGGIEDTGSRSTATSTAATSAGHVPAETPATGSATTPGTAPESAPETARDDDSLLDERDAWDALTQGDDPS